VSAWRPDDSNSLLEELARLCDQVGRFVGQRLDLVTAELRQGTQDTLRRTALVAVGAMGAAVGAMFLLLALGVWVGELIGTIAGALAMVGAGLTLVAGLLAGWAIRSLRTRRFAPETIRALRRDAEWIRHMA
jgi:uncharacterized membrane protein YqjE